MMKVPETVPVLGTLSQMNVISHYVAIPVVALLLYPQSTWRLLSCCLDAVSEVQGLGTLCSGQLTVL